MPTHAKKNEVEELATIALTAEQKDEIAKATGVSVNELSVLKVSGLAARQLNPSLLQGHTVVACW
jgi:hypothetical protein